MEIKDVLNETDLLDNTHSPVLDLFNTWACCGFDILLDSLSCGIGAGSPLAGCFFIHSSNDSTHFSSSRSGIYFESECADDVLISFSDFYYYMTLASKRYLTNHPSDQTKIKKHLTIYRDRFLIESK